MGEVNHLTWPDSILAAQDRPGERAPGRRLPGAGAQGVADGPAASTGAPVLVAVQADDPTVGAATVAALRRWPGIVPVPVAGAADVVLVLADWLSDDMVAWMQRVADQSERSAARFVLVGDWIPVPQLMRAVSCGLMSVLPGRGTTNEQVARAIFRVQQGTADMPAGGLRALPAGSPGVGGLSADPVKPGSRLEDREVDVLRLVAEGLDTAQIAQRLNYSERTIKHVIHVMLDRLQLKNRPHAVAFAIRSGLI
jgi:DNA-binding NarL/FixJ family response regulator